MSDKTPTISGVSPFFSQPAEILERIFLYLPAASLRRLICATYDKENNGAAAAAAAAADEQWAHFRQILRSTLSNVDLCDTLRASHPSTTSAIQRRLGADHLRYSKDGEGIRRILTKFETGLREGRCDHRRTVLEDKNNEDVAGRVRG